MQTTAELNLPWRAAESGRFSNRAFGALLISCIASSALMASVFPLQLSIVTVFLFAGPHNWFEFRYFLARLPIRLGKSRNFFLVAFSGVTLLTLSYVALPFLFRATYWPRESWLSVLALWNTLFLLWLGLLVWLRGRLKRRTDWFLAIPVAFGVSALNWLAPEIFSLTIVYVHPLIALWFLDRHVARTKPTWLRTYRRCLLLLPLLLTVMVWQLSKTTSLADDNGLFWRITQHSGAELLPGVSSHLLVSVQLFLELLHYGVWLLALSLIQSASAAQKQESHFWTTASVPIARHRRGFPRTAGALMILGALLVGLLWVGFSIDYATTRDIYFTLAITHVLAEAPFLLRML